jgi:hypothetical protein
MVAIATFDLSLNFPMRLAPKLVHFLGKDGTRVHTQTKLCMPISFVRTQATCGG